MPTNKLPFKQNLSRIAAMFFLLDIFLSACNIPQFEIPEINEIVNPDNTLTPYLTPTANSKEAEIEFRVQAPQNTPADQQVYLKLMEEITGLAFNPQLFPMKNEGEGYYSATLTVPTGTVIKYRYARMTSTSEVQEHISDGRQVRYRLYSVLGSGVVEDVVSRWTDTQFEGTTGRISGLVLDATSHAPLPNILIVCGGVQTLTSSDGSYLIEGLLPGVHNLVAYALNGSYRTFQQGAKVSGRFDHTSRNCP